MALTFVCFGSLSSIYFMWFGYACVYYRPSWQRSQLYSQR